MDYSQLFRRSQFNNIFILLVSNIQIENMLIIEKINENEIEELRWFVYWVYNECKVLQLVL